MIGSTFAGKYRPNHRLFSAVFSSLMKACQSMRNTNADRKSDRSSGSVTYMR